MLKARPPAAAPVQRAPAGALFSAESARAQVSVLRGMNAFDRHRHFMQHYRRYTASAPGSSVEKSEIDVVRDEHRFLWGGEEGGLSWEQRLAKRYHDKLFKEYALADMSRYREGQVGLRWRTEAEVFDGKGQFVCGDKCCSEGEGLASFELLFAYVEHGERRQALVKLRVCPRCERRLHYRERKERKRERKRERKELAKGRGRAPKRRRAEAARRAQSEEESGESSDEEGRARSGDGAAPAAAAPAAVPPEAAASAGGDDVWRRGAVADKTQEEEMDDYFDVFCAPLLA